MVGENRLEFYPISEIENIQRVGYLANENLAESEPVIIPLYKVVYNIRFISLDGIITGSQSANFSSCGPRLVILGTRKYHLITFRE